MLKQVGAPSLGHHPETLYGAPPRNALRGTTPKPRRSTELSLRLIQQSSRGNQTSMTSLSDSTALHATKHEFKGLAGKRGMIFVANQLIFVEHDVIFVKN